MKKGFLLIIFFSLLFLSSAFSEYGIVCGGSDPTRIVVLKYNFSYDSQDNSFWIYLSNGTGKDINIVSVSSQGQFAITESTLGLLTTRAEAKIAGTYPQNNIINEKISFNYLTEDGNKKETIIQCTGLSPIVAAAQETAGLLSVLVPGLVLFIIGGIVTIYSQKKKKDKTKIIGIIILGIGLIFLFYALLIFANMIIVQR